MRAPTGQVRLAATGRRAHINNEIERVSSVASSDTAAVTAITTVVQLLNHSSFGGARAAFGSSSNSAVSGWHGE
jgi:hypothetical protein